MYATVPENEERSPSGEYVDWWQKIVKCEWVSVMMQRHAEVRHVMSADRDNGEFAKSMRD